MWDNGVCSVMILMSLPEIIQNAEINTTHTLATTEFICTGNSIAMMSKMTLALQSFPCFVILNSFRIIKYDIHCGVGVMYPRKSNNLT